MINITRKKIFALVLFCFAFYLVSYFLLYLYSYHIINIEIQKMEMTEISYILLLHDNDEKLLDKRIPKHALIIENILYLIKNDKERTDDFYRGDATGGIGFKIYLNEDKFYVFYLIYSSSKNIILCQIKRNNFICINKTYYTDKDVANVFFDNIKTFQ